MGNPDWERFVGLSFWFRLKQTWIDLESVHSKTRTHKSHTGGCNPRWWGWEIGLKTPNLRPHKNHALGCVTGCLKMGEPQHGRFPFGFPKQHHKGGFLKRHTSALVRQVPALKLRCWRALRDEEFDGETHLRVLESGYFTHFTQASGKSDTSLGASIFRDIPCPKNKPGLQLQLHLGQAGPGVEPGRNEAVAQEHVAIAERSSLSERVVSSTKAGKTQQVHGGWGSSYTALGQKAAIEPWH